MPRLDRRISEAGSGRDLSGFTGDLSWRCSLELGSQSFVFLGMLILGRLCS